MSAKKNLEWLQALASRHPRGQCLATEYKGMSVKYPWGCKEGHRWEAIAGNVQQGYWCLICSGKAPKTLEDCQNLAKLRNGKCASTEYKNNRTKMEWECQEGHRWGARAASIQQGQWCRICAGLAPKTLEWCQELAKLKNGKCLSTKYKNNRTKMEWECQEGHRWEAIATNTQRGKWCLICSGKALKDIYYLHFLASLHIRGKCLSSKYKGNKGKYLWECEKGHTWRAQANNIQQGKWCPICGHQVSKKEKELFEVIKETYPDTLPNKRGLLKNKKFELDIYIPSLRIGIEYDGEHWHNRESSKDRDFRKNQQCQEASIKLIRISDTEYLRDPQGVQQRLLNQLKEIQLAL